MVNTRKTTGTLRALIGGFCVTALWLPSLGCGAPAPAKCVSAATLPAVASNTVAATPGGAAAPDKQASVAAVNKVLDDWHAAAAAADEKAYFDAFATDGVFLGTDATERWELEAFRRFAHPHFAKGKAWSFKATRRTVIVDGVHAWFDEDLATPNLGPSRGSGVLRYQDGAWKIAHYNLTLTIPNDALKAVKKAIENQANEAAAAKSAAAKSGEAKSAPDKAASP